MSSICSTILIRAFKAQVPAYLFSFFSYYSPQWPSSCPCQARSLCPSCSLCTKCTAPKSLHRWSFLYFLGLRINFASFWWGVSRRPHNNIAPMVICLTSSCHVSLSEIPWFDNVLTCVLPVSCLLEHDLPESWDLCPHAHCSNSGPRRCLAIQTNNKHLLNEWMNEWSDLM